MTNFIRESIAASSADNRAMKSVAREPSPVERTHTTTPTLSIDRPPLGRKRVASTVVRDYRAAPFQINVNEVSGSSLKITVSPGYLFEIVPGEEDALLYHEPENLWDGDELAEFSVSEGQAIYIQATINEYGNVEGEISIVIEDDNAESTHYQPRVDDETTDGASGEMKYKLAVVNSVVPVEIEAFVSGNHIVHYQDLPSILSTNDPGDGIGVIPKKWDNDARAYKLRSVNKGLGENNVTTNDDHVEVRGTKKALNVLVQYGNIEVTTPDVEFKDGYCKTGTDIIGDEPSPPEPDELKILIPTVEVESQFSVSFENNIFTVGGNDKTGKRYIQVEGESPQLIVEWEDGQVTSEGEQTITVPAGGGEGWSGDIVLNDCDPGGGSDPWGAELLRISVANGSITAVAVGTVAASSLARVLLQSCHWIDDPPNDDWRGA